MNENLAHNLTASAQRYPDSAALRIDDVVITYAELDEATARVAGLLRERGLEPGDRVGIMLPNVPQFAFAYYGVLRAGGVVVPMNVLLKQREVEFYLGDPEAKADLRLARVRRRPPSREPPPPAPSASLVEPVSFGRLLAGAEPFEEVVDRAADDTAVILYTSGTTGKPKGAELTHSNLAINADVSKALFSLGHEDVILGALPLFHAFGQTCGLNAAISAGASLTLIPRFSAGRGARGDRARSGDGVRGRADDVLRAAQPLRARAIRREHAPRVRVRRSGAAGRGAARVRGGVRVRDPRGLRAVGDLAGRVLQPSRPGAQAGLDRHPDRGRRDEARRRPTANRWRRARSARSRSAATT